MDTTWKTHTKKKKIIEEWPCTLMQVFGTAEGLLSFTSPDDDVAVIARCQGTPVSPADEVKIVDERDEEVPTGVFGELLSRGPYTRFLKAPDSKAENYVLPATLRDKHCFHLTGSALLTFLHYTYSLYGYGESIWECQLYRRTIAILLERYLQRG